MAMKQPKVPPMREKDRLEQTVRELVLFLKDFCMESWAEHRRQGEQIARLRKEIDGMK